MIISEQHNKDKAKPGETRKSPDRLGPKSPGHARSGNPQQSVLAGEDDEKEATSKATPR
ncbi:hypothetical protein MKI84_09505 [Ancylobacter sp. A5.8]|uniref:hypothetical protein n=1 Tax=Ancylobacter gelatini TaxID=2919920 RepID=UPI001F4E8BC9|nr:hypothetical protein [Ancylobacter gelatini]MCJ8143155.1 hypothetical protein [Ancylobacter gelatini]